MLRLTAGHLSFGWVAAVSACKHREAALTWLSAPQHHTDENSWCVSVSVCKTPRGYWGSHTHAHTHIPHPPTDTTTTRTFPVIPITEWHYKLSRRVREGEGKGGGKKGKLGLSNMHTVTNVTWTVSCAYSQFCLYIILIISKICFCVTSRKEIKWQPVSSQLLIGFHWDC